MSSNTSSQEPTNPARLLPVEIWTSILYIVPGPSPYRWRQRTGHSSVICSYSALLWWQSATAQLARLSATCRYIQQIAIPLLYEIIFLKWDFPKEATKTAKMLSRIHESPSLAGYVKTLLVFRHKSNLVDDVLAAITPTLTSLHNVTIANSTISPTLAVLMGRASELDFQSCKWEGGEVQTAPVKKLVFRNGRGLYREGWTGPRARLFIGPGTTDLMINADELRLIKSAAGLQVLGGVKRLNVNVEGRDDRIPDRFFDADPPLAVEELSVDGWRHGLEFAPGSLPRLRSLEIPQAMLDKCQGLHTVERLIVNMMDGPQGVMKIFSTSPFPTFDFPALRILDIPTYGYKNPIQSVAERNRYPEVLEQLTIRADLEEDQVHDFPHISKFPNLRSFTYDVVENGVKSLFTDTAACRRVMEAAREKNPHLKVVRWTEGYDWRYENPQGWILHRPVDDDEDGRDLGRLFGTQ